MLTNSLEASCHSPSDEVFSQRMLSVFMEPKEHWQGQGETVTRGFPLLCTCKEEGKTCIAVPAPGWEWRALIAQKQRCLQQESCSIWQQPGLEKRAGADSLSLYYEFLNSLGGLTSFSFSFHFLSCVFMFPPLSFLWPYRKHGYLRLSLIKTAPKKK